jgi:hypothetical protein
MSLGPLSRRASSRALNPVLERNIQALSTAGSGTKRKPAFRKSSPTLSRISRVASPSSTYTLLSL